MIRLFAIDVDGTLLNDEGELPAKNQVSILNALNSGVHIVLVTGRPMNALEHLISSLELEFEPIVPLAGSVVIESAGEGYAGAIWEESLSRESLGSLFLLLKGEPLSVFAFSTSGSVIFHGDNSPEYRKYFDMILQTKWMGFTEFQLLDSNPLFRASKGKLLVHKLMLHSNDISLVERVKQKLRAAGVPNINILGSSPGTIDIHASSTGKAKAVQFLANHFGLRSSEVMAIGDAEADIQLIHWASIGAVVANASDGVRSQAKLIAPANSDAGVAWMIERYVL